MKRNKTLSKNSAGFNIGITSHKLSEYAFVLFVDDKSNLEHTSKTWNVVCGIQDKFCAVFSNCSIKCTKSELEGVVVKRFSSQMTDVIF